MDSHNSDDAATYIAAASLGKIVAGRQPFELVQETALLRRVVELHAVQPHFHEDFQQPIEGVDRIRYLGGMGEYCDSTRIVNQ